METLLEIAVYSVMMMGILGTLGAAFVFAGYALAEEARPEEEHE